MMQGVRRLALLRRITYHCCTRTITPKTVPRPALVCYRPGSRDDHYDTFSTESIHMPAALTILAMVPVATSMFEADGDASGDDNNRPSSHTVYYVKEAKKLLKERLARFRAQRWQQAPYPLIVVSKEIGGPYCLEVPLPITCHYARVIAGAIGAWGQDAVRVHTIQSDTDTTFLSFVVDGQSVGKGRSSLLLTCPRSGPSKLLLYRDEGFTDADVKTAVEAYEVAWSTASSGSTTAGIPELLDSIIRKSQDLVEQGGGPLGRRSGKWRSKEGEAGVAPKEDLGAKLHKLGAELIDKSTLGEGRLGWDCMAGYDEVKQAVEDNLILALRHPETYQKIASYTRMRVEPDANRPRAVLFEGPPGTGKTLTARIVSSLTDLPLVNVPVERILTKWYGESERNLSLIFEICNSFEGGALIFIDEIDALATSRDSGNMHEATRRILSVILQNVEGFKQGSKSVLICATNRRQDLDSALLSRFDTCIRFDLPSSRARVEVYRRYAKHLTDADLQLLAERSVNFSCRDIKEMCECAERRWASKLIKGKEQTSAPSISEYLSAAHSRMRMVEHPQQQDNRQQQHRGSV